MEKIRAQWYSEYLLSLRERPQSRSRMPFSNRLQVEDVKLIKSPLKTRTLLALGIVVELIHVVRAARVKQC